MNKEDIPGKDTENKSTKENLKTENISDRAEEAHQKKPFSNKRLLFLSISALGIVFGNIGTSPLYALKVCFYGFYAVAITDSNVLGVLSLIFWSLILIISIKYVLIVMRASNDGEGGILALMELIRPENNSKSTKYFLILAIGLFGTAMLYGDGIITPAISVLSAVEGLNVASPFFEPFIIPLTVLILIILFSVQYKGTIKAGKILGPLTFLWFVVIGLLGAISVFETPEVLYSMNPVFGFNFFIENGFHGFVILGAVFLVVTGGEALYAEMGHFGTRPLKFAWFSLVLPCLLLNYFGQGALILRDQTTVLNPFYQLAPEWALYPLIILAVIATLVASQTVISGSFSLTFQALQLGFLPRIRILHTSELERGQIYIPRLNWVMCFATIAMVIGFKSSTNLAATYGVAVATTMVMTTILTYYVMSKFRNWNYIVSAGITIIFLLISLAFWGANLMKIFHGAWIPLGIGTAVYFMMITWYNGRKNLLIKIQQQTLSLQNFITEIMSIRMIAIPGTAVYMTSNADGTPSPLILNIKHNRLLHKQIIILTIKFHKIPHVRQENRVEIKEPTDGFYKVVANYGYMDITNIQQILGIMESKGVNVKIEKTTFFLGRETLIPRRNNGLAKFRDKLFILMSSNSQRATEFFNIPPNRVFEVGTQIEL